jgi:thiamine pyrophosphate-dependent acetolactate synthase large subunit-like protein
LEGASKEQILMSFLTSDWLVQRLKAWGVTRIFGYPGDGINGVLGALQREEKDGKGIEFIQVRHEEMAAFMATAHAISPAKSASVYRLAVPGQLIW